MQQTPELLNTTVYSTQFSLIPSFIRSALPGEHKAPNILPLHTTIVPQNGNTVWEIVHIRVLQALYA